MLFTALVIACNEIIGATALHILSLIKYHEHSDCLKKEVNRSYNRPRMPFELCEKMSLAIQGPS